MKKMKLWKPTVLTLAVLLVTSIILPLSASAIEYGGFGGRPAYPRSENPRTESIFIHTLNPGATQKEGIQVINNSDETKILEVYATDSTPSTGGAFACKQMAEKQIGVGSWIKLIKNEVKLAAGTNEIIPFDINVPMNAGVGEHNGCILVQEKRDLSENQVGMNLSIRTGIRVAITVPGEIFRNLQIEGFTVTPRDNGGYLLHPLVKNTGNVSINTNVSVKTRYFFGPLLFVHGGEYPVLRDATSDWNFELNKPFWGGFYRSTFAVTYNPNSDSNSNPDEMISLKSPSIWFFSFPTIPGLIIEIAVLIFLVSIFMIWRVSRKRNNWIKNNWVQYQVTAGEDIKTLAKKHDVSWKLLVKVNGLKPPYVLSNGETIKVPPIVR